MTKSSSLSNLNEKAGFLSGLITQARLTWRLFRDSRVSGWVKFIPVAGLLYLLSPIDLIPDLALPILGEVDDVAILLLALKLFVDFSPANIVRQHMEDMSGTRKGQPPTDDPSADSYIDASYRVLDDPSTRKDDAPRRTG